MRLPVYIDYPSVRVDTEHEETPRNGRSWCEVCGWTDKLDIEDHAAVLWHGDTFDLLTQLEVWEDLYARHGEGKS